MDDAIRPAGPDAAATLAAGLAHLSAELGEPHRMDAAHLAAAMRRPEPAFRALIAGTRGLVLYSPVFSTVTGGAGAYVSDLWVAPEARGGGLGRRLLAAAARDAAARWGAIHLTLAVYDDSAQARGFYARLGFAPIPGQRFALDPAATERLKGET
jgi:ribosomal protein S18 acetylase RimI-like enzyme